MKDTLKGQVAFVTGASRGIGAAIVQALGQRGATIVGADINEAAAAEIQKALDAAGFPGWGAVLDVTDGAACEAVIGEVEKRGPILAVSRRVDPPPLAPGRAWGRRVNVETVDHGPL